MYAFMITMRSKLIAIDLNADFTTNNHRNIRLFFSAIQRNRFTSLNHNANSINFQASLKVQIRCFFEIDLMIQIISINFQQIDDFESKSEFEYFFLSFEISNNFQQIDDFESKSVFEYSFFSFDTFSSKSKFSFSNSFSILRAFILNSNFNHRK